MQINENNTKSKVPYVIGAILGVAVLGTAVAWVFGLNKSGSTPNTGFEATSTTPTDTTTTTGGPTSVPTSPTTTTPAGTSQTYKDGTYNAAGTYRTEGGNEGMTVSITLVKDVVTATTFTVQAVDPAGVQYQQSFSANYKPLVIGKKLDSLSLGTVSGASLTSRAFNNALVQIKSSAKI